MHRFFYYTLDQLIFLFSIPFTLIIIGRSVDAGLGMKYLLLLFIAALFVSPDLVYHFYAMSVVAFWLMPTQTPMHFMDMAFHNYFQKMESLNRKLREQEQKLRGFSKESRENASRRHSKVAEKRSHDAYQIKTLKDCFDVLDIDADAIPDDIKAAYKRKIAQYHPDKVAKLGDKLKEVSEIESRKLNLAYEFLQKNGRI